MAFKVVALAGNTSTTTGTSDIFVGGALPAPFRSLASVLSDLDTFPYCIRDNVNFECGLATWHAGTSSFTRTRVDQSSIGNVVINFSSGTRNVFCDYGVAMFLYGPNNGSDIPSPSAFRTALGLGTAATATLGSGANQVPQITAGGKYPAVDGTPFAATTAILFYQAAAPTGFTRVTTIDDTLVAITNNSGTGGGGPHAAGTTDPGTGTPWDQSFGLTISGHALTVAEMGATSNGTLNAGAVPFLNTSGGAAHSHGATSAATLRPPRAFCSLCTKN